jgi:hypothetical protein
MGTNPKAQEWAPAGVDGGLPGAIEHGFEPALSGDGNVLAYKSRDDGAVYIWRYYEYYDAWYPLGNISRGPGDTSSGRFGYSLAFRRTGDRIAIGAPCAEDPCAAAGKVYVYYQSGGPSWGTTWDVRVDVGRRLSNRNRDGSRRRAREGVRVDERLLDPGGE